jgi:glycosyltransferase involved in cell wall biosynthesis
VVFTGLVTGPERIEALADADVVVYASEHEIFGLVPFEALLAGTPVIVADDSGCGDLVGATGGAAVVRVNDVGALAYAIDEILAHPAVWRLKAERAQQHIRALHGSDVVCEQLEGVYEELLADRQPVRDGLTSLRQAYGGPPNRFARWRKGVPNRGVFNRASVNRPNGFPAGRPSA